NGCRSILGEGLAYDRCHVGVVTNLDQAEAFPDFYVQDAEQVAKVLRTQVDVVLPEGVAVLNADDALVADMAGLCDGGVIFFGMAAAAPVLALHLAQGGRAVVVPQGQIVVAQGQEATRLNDINGGPLAPAGQRVFQVQDVLAAAAAAWALDIS